MALGISRGSGTDNSVKIVANIFISFIGAGVLGLPYAFKEAGILEGITILSVVAYFSVKSMIIIIECKEEILRRKLISNQRINAKVQVSEILLPSGNRVELKLPLLSCEEDSDAEAQSENNDADELLTYGDVGHYALGDSGRGLIDLVVLVSQIGFCCAYLIFIMENLSKFFTSLTHFHWLLLILPPLFFITLLRHLSKLAIFSLFAQITNLFAFSVVFWFDFEHFNVVKFHPKEFSLKGFPFFFAVAIYCYEGAGMILSLEHSLALSIRHKFPYYLTSTLIGVTLLYMCFGTSGYLSFGPETSDIITFNLPTDKGFNFANLVTSCLCLSLFLTYPIMIFPAIQLLEARLLTSDDITKGNALRFVVVSMTGMIVIAVPNFGNLMALVGATCCTLLAFILPGIIHLIIFEKKLTEKQKLFDIFIIFLGIVGTVIGTWDAVARMRIPKQIHAHTGFTTARPFNGTVDVNLIHNG
ncbi:amino acid transporter AVT3B-like [Ischnura elegans]|uniref:amino acid transporter AVT3B-like n=1 Tax=Ischnura elegans TaxID=197161 RepID=UPI001ED86F70|nr:amino acid transporter AVT3B-like [Ischnura elegans]